MLFYKRYSYFFLQTKENELENVFFENKIVRPKSFFVWLAGYLYKFCFGYYKIKKSRNESVCSKILELLFMFDRAEKIFFAIFIFATETPWAITKNCSINGLKRAIIDSKNVINMKEVNTKSFSLSQKRMR